MNIQRKVLITLLFISLIGSASATVGNIDMNATFQPILDLIGLVVNNTGSWIGLIIIGVMIMVAKGIGAFITNTLNDATR